jgi:hypothetical protein
MVHIPNKLLKLMTTNQLRMITVRKRAETIRRIKRVVVEISELSQAQIRVKCSLLLIKSPTAYEFGGLKKNKEKNRVAPIDLRV